MGSAAPHGPVLPFGGSEPDPGAGTAWEGSPSCLWGGTALEEQRSHLCQLGMGAELCPLSPFGTWGSLWGAL